mgnify:CR=1 FL=1
MTCNGTVPEKKFRLKNVALSCLDFFEVEHNWKSVTIFILKVLGIWLLIWIFRILWDLFIRGRS